MGPGGRSSYCLSPLRPSTGVAAISTFFKLKKEKRKIIVKKFKYREKALINKFNLFWIFFFANLKLLR